MIFKTFDTNVDKMSAKWGIFGKSFNEIGQAIKGRINDVNNALAVTNDLSASLKDSPSIWARLFPSKESIKSQLIDIDALYPDKSNSQFSSMLSTLVGIDEQVKSGVGNWQDYFEGLGKGEEWQIDFVKNTDLQKASLKDVKNSYEAARQSALAHNAALKQQTISAKAATAATAALKTALSAIAYFAIAQALSFIITKIDESVNAIQNGVEKINNLDNEIKSFNSEIKDLNDKLSDTKIKINALEKLPKLTLLQKEELEALKAYNDELERQRRERENAAESAKIEASKTAEKLYSDMTTPRDIWGLSIFTQMSNQWSGKTLSDQIKVLENYKKIQNELKEIRNSSEYELSPSNFDDAIKEKEDQLRELEHEISNFYTTWNKIATDLIPYNTYTDNAVLVIQSLIDEWDTLSGKVKTTLTDILNDSQFAVVKQYLEDLAIKGELTVDKFNSLTENEVTGIDRFREALKNVKDSDVTDVVESINQEIKESAKEADNTADGIQNLSEAFEKLYDAINDVLSKQEKLADAFKKTRLGAKLTIQELYELIKEMPSLAQYASKDGDGYTISTEGF